MLARGPHEPDDDEKLATANVGRLRGALARCATQETLGPADVAEITAAPLLLPTA